MKINVLNYIPPKTLGEGLNRVKQALNCGELIKNANGFRLYRAKDHGTVYMTIAELHKTKDIVPLSAELKHTDYDTYAGTALRLRKSPPCGKMGIKPNQIMQYIRTWFYSDAVKSASGVKSKPIHAITDFAVINGYGGKPVVKYGCGKNYDVSQAKLPAFVKEIKSQDVPKEYTGVKAPDGNIIYYLKDTEKDGKRRVIMKMYENGLDVPIIFDDRKIAKSSQK